MAVVRSLPLGGRHPRTAFVLGGGGNLGAMQVGMLRAALEHGLVPDLIVGCSAGALNGAAIAADPTLEGVEQLAELWRSLDDGGIWPSGRLAGPWLLLRKGKALHTNDGLRAVLEAHLPERFEDLQVPFQCVAVSLARSAERWFWSGPLAAPLLASAALPAVFPPVAIDGEDYIDGGVIDNVPVSRALALGAERLVVMHVGNFFRPRPEPKRPLDVLLQAFSIGRGFRFHLDMRNLPTTVEAVVLPAVVPPAKLRYDDFSRSEELMTRAHAMASDHLRALRASAGG